MLVKSIDVSVVAGGLLQEGVRGLAGRKGTSASLGQAAAFARATLHRFAAERAAPGDGSVEQVRRRVLPGPLVPLPQQLRLLAVAEHRSGAVRELRRERVP